MISKYDVVKEQHKIIIEQQELIKCQERDNAVLLCFMCALMLLAFFDAVWH